MSLASFSSAIKILKDKAVKKTIMRGQRAFKDARGFFGSCPKDEPLELFYTLSP